VGIEPTFSFVRVFFFFCGSPHLAVGGRWRRRPPRPPPTGGARQVLQHSGSAKAEKGALGAVSAATAFGEEISRGPGPFGLGGGEPLRAATMTPRPRAREDQGNVVAENRFSVRFGCRGYSTSLGRGIGGSHRRLLPPEPASTSARIASIFFRWWFGDREKRKDQNGRSGWMSAHPPRSRAVVLNGPGATVGRPEQGWWGEAILMV